MSEAQELEASSSDFPRSLSELEVSWLRSTLVRAGLPGADAIVDFEATVIGVGEGFMAQLARVTLRSAGDAGGLPSAGDAGGLSSAGGAGGLPSSLIAKFASPDASTREFARVQNVYKRELGFYRDIGDEAGIPVPRCYYGEFDETTCTFVLLLEDLQPAEPVDQVKGATVEQSRQVVESFARLHARWWNSERLASFDWSKPVIDEQPLEAGREMIEAAIVKADTEGHFDAYPEMKALLRRLPALFRIEPPPPYPFTLVHGDLRSDNVFFPTAAGGRFTMIDWQMCGVDLAARDLARWLVQSITVEQRRATEDELLERYYELLVENGVRGYSLKKLRSEYQLSIVVMYLMFAGGVDQIDTSAERSEALFHAMYSRLDAALVDWKVGQLLKVLPLLVPFFKLGTWLRIKFARQDAAE